MNEIMINDTLQDENDKRLCKRYLRLVRHTPCDENDDDRDQIEEVVIYQGCNRKYFNKLHSVFRGESVGNSAKLK